MASTVWRGHISFGLVTVPVYLTRAARKERVKLRELYRPTQAKPGLRVVESPLPPPGGSEEAPEEAKDEIVEPIHRAPVIHDRSEIVRDTAITKGAEIAPNRFVTLDREELKSLEPKTSPTMEITEFVRLADVDPVYFEASYYVRPAEAGEQAYALLYEAMRQTGLIAVATVAMHRREHVVILRPGRSGLLAHTMFFEFEVRSADEYKADSTLVNPKNLELAKMLAKQLETSFNPAKYRDSYRDRLEALIAAKERGERTATIARTEPAPRRVADISEALRKSLDAIKKPAASAAPQTRPAAKKRRAK